MTTKEHAMLLSAANKELREIVSAQEGEIKDLRVRIIGFKEKLETETAPIPMRIVCPDCKKLHIDEGEFVTKIHHTHSCQYCGLTWRPAVPATVGVRFLPGFKDEGNLE